MAVAVPIPPTELDIFEQDIDEQVDNVIETQNEFHDNDIIGDIEQWARVHALTMGNGTIAPVTIVPHRFERAKFDQAVALAPLFGELVQAVSEDTQFIIDSLSGLPDEFTQKLLNLLITSKNAPSSQKITFGILRSDYMIDKTSNRLLQVELNAIAAGAGGLATKVAQLHKFIVKWHSSSTENKANDVISAMPDNIALDSLVAGLAAAHRAYLDQQAQIGSEKVAILMVVQKPPEYNLVDQNMLKFGLQNQHGIRVIRKTLADVEKFARFVSDPAAPSTSRMYLDGFEISVAYFRAGYHPRDYPSAVEWRARELIEQSYSIKCPSIAYQLVGTKKMQQVLSDREVLARFLSCKEKVDQVSVCTTTLLPLGGNDADLLQRTVFAPGGEDDFVMKPQREGGGNLLVHDDMMQALQSLSDVQRLDYVLMRRIRPQERKSIFLRGGRISVVPNSVAELGIFTIYLKTPAKVEINQFGGFLVRTKPATVEDGGISSRACLDSPILI